MAENVKVKQKPAVDISAIIKRALDTIHRAKVTPSLYTMVGTYELARKAKITVSYASRLRNGNRNPSAKMTKRLAGVLGVTMEEMMAILEKTREDGHERK